MATARRAADLGRHRTLGAAHGEHLAELDPQLDLVDAGAHAIARTLRTLKARLPAGKSLSSVRVVVVGDDVLVKEQDSLWDPESGQIQIDFPMSSLTREVAPMVKAAAKRAVWFSFTKICPAPSLAASAR